LPFTVLDKAPKATENLVQAGARAGKSAQDVVDSSEVVLTCLPASPDVEALYLEPGGLIERARPGTILIDLSCVLPSTPRKLEPAARKRGVHFLEAPVSGGTAGARAATLAIMVGGDPQILEKAKPVLKCIGPNIFSVGPVGAGNTVKAINNMMACVNSLAMMEGLTLGVKAGLVPMVASATVIRPRTSVHGKCGPGSVLRPAGTAMSSWPTMRSTGIRYFRQSPVASSMSASICSAV